MGEELTPVGDPVLNGREGRRRRWSTAAGGRRFGSVSRGRSGRRGRRPPLEGEAVWDGEAPERLGRGNAQRTAADRGTEESAGPREDDGVADEELHNPRECLRGNGEEFMAELEREKGRPRSRRTHRKSSPEFVLGEGSSRPKSLRISRV